MAQKDTKIKIIDNSGALTGKCLYFGKLSVFKPGTIITIVVKNAKRHKKIKKGNICKAIIVRCAYVIKRRNGLYLYDRMNAGIILKKNEIFPIGTRFFGPICVELRKLQLIKLITLAPYLI